ncbi:ionotropic receptor 25a-like [Eriocheir sinensis]|uniref:ionotropic receptor 25a-like n=1 Tax=Eriocheir sinensis TaxID=95602 RepID=UPI0021CA80A0|nr:ionotropic receptor 25a-like [Eriocheir sinensis]XP_050723402.1 ionotropic receptor 25a-like [Eriocheir sinensis]XP_050723403.1 ionotropic receptor 25a-like [Eriocheir sinensis]XP_050723404.1 ionotropic receptor 25a-like [Eriocheir sinensis]XP_050723405.1 ionotropic receptor 25a-like [Eriocheir sinensis]XP_050723406.1 ionotropic receptor 25a-like [Eriocheir sinensis]XP_050723407.1 ionotropic receptor 25a-like [Eriocheir sinensis]XP_050723408.1 ionotropic receptor 25a-like [Eriocheir sinen
MEWPAATSTARPSASQALLLFFLAATALTLTTAQNVNIMVMHEVENEPATSGILAAIKYLENTGGATIGIKEFMALKKGDDVEATVNDTCAKLDAAIDAGKAPHIVIDATTTGLLSETAKSITRALALPTFSASYGQEGDIREWRDLTAEEEKYLVQAMPPGDILVMAVRDIVETQNITNAGIIYDNTFVMDHKYKSLLMNLPCRHILTEVEATEMALRKQTKRLMDADIVNYFVVGSKETISRVLDAATANGMFGRKYSWYAVSKGKDDIQCGCENSTVVYLRPEQPTKNRIGMLQRDYGLGAKPAIDAAFYFDFTLRGIKAAALLAKEGKYVNFKYVKCDNYDENDPIIRTDMDLLGALKRVTMEETWGTLTWGGNGMTFPKIPLTMDKFMILSGRTAERKSLGKWDAGMPGALMFTAGMDLTDHQAVTVYRVTTVRQSPFIMQRTNEDGKIEFYGYCIDLINEIKQIVQFEYEIYEAPDGKFGTMSENMEWDGMIKELIEKRADIALAPLSVMAERENVVDFTVPYYDLVGITILMKKPKVPTSLFKFLTVLEPEVWVCILFAYGFTSVLLYVFDRFSPYSYQNNKERYKDDDEKREFTFKECLWFCMTSLTPQGGGEAPKNLSGRLVAATWWLFGFIIIASYTANLAAFLTVSRLDTPIESLDDLSNQYKVQYAPMNGTSTMTYFERMAYIEKKFYEIWKDMSLNDSMSPVERAKLAVWDYPVSDKYTKMWQSMQEAGLPTTLESAVERVRKSTSSSEGFAYLGDATDIRYLVLTNCDLQIVGEEFSRKPYAVAVQQGSPLKDQFNDAILKLLNQRKLETLKERWWNQNPEKKTCEKDDDQSDGISIENIGGVFIVIFVGIGLACVTLAFEYWWYKHRKTPRITDSGRVVNVKEFPSGDVQKTNFTSDKSNFNTEYNNDGYDIAPVGNPW